MSYSGPIQRQKDYCKANTAPRGWARWLPVLRAPSPCKYSEAGGQKTPFGQIRLHFLSIPAFEPEADVDTLSSIWQEWEYAVPLGPASDTEF